MLILRNVAQMMVNCLDWLHVNRRAARRGQGGRLTTLNFRTGAVTTLNFFHVLIFVMK